MKRAVPFLAASSLCLFLMGCPPDFDKPDHDGIKPGANAQARDITVTADLAVPVTLDCDDRKQIEVQVTQSGVNCTGFNYTALVQRAKDLVDARIALVNCPTSGACTLKNSFYTYWTWNCTGTAATAGVKAYVVCATADNAQGKRKGVQPPANKSAPATVSDTGEDPNFHSVPDGEWIEDKSANAPTWSLGCPSKTLLCLVYKEKDPTGSAPESHFQSYQGYIDRAKAEAQMIYSKYVCPGTPAPGCNKVTPMKVKYTEWGFNATTGNVEVTVYFEVECKKN